MIFYKLEETKLLFFIHFQNQNNFGRDPPRETLCTDKLIFRPDMRCTPRFSPKWSTQNVASCSGKQMHNRKGRKDGAVARRELIPTFSKLHCSFENVGYMIYSFIHSPCALVNGLLYRCILSFGHRAMWCWSLTEKQTGGAKSTVSV